jgi:hypothetical protein
MESPDAIKKAGVRRAPNGRALELHPAMRQRMWQPGQSANPSGKGGLYHEVVKMAREASPRAIARLQELMESDDERVAAVACNSLLERAFGKPKEFDPKSEPATGVPMFDPRAVSSEQLQLIKKALVLMQQATTVVEVQNDG